MRFAQIALIIAIFACIAGAQSFNRTVSSRNLLTSSISIPSNVSIYSPLPISFNITNLDSGAVNDIFVEVNIQGPTSASTSFYTMPLSPGQMESVLIYLPNATGKLGTYYAYVNSSYVSDNTRYRSGSAVQYSVFYSTYAIQPKGVQAISKVKNVSITYLPYVNYLALNSTFGTKLGISNPGSNAIFVNVSVPSRFASLLSFSTKELFVSPNQSIISNLVFNPVPGAPPGTYIIPVTITKIATGSSPTSQQTQYINFYTFSNSSTTPSLYNQIYLANNTDAAYGIIQAHAPGLLGLTDTIVKLMLNSSVASSLSKLSASGAQENITSQNGSDIIQWHIGSLPQGQSKYLYYGATNISNLTDLGNAELVLLSSSVVSGQDIFKLLNTIVPTLYTNTLTNITVNMEYTGTSSGAATFGLTGPLGSYISNPTQVVNVTPNQVITRKFNINMGNTSGVSEDLIFSVSSSAGARATYSVPVVVIERSASVTGVLSTQVPIFKYILLTIVVMAGLLLFLRNRLPEKRQAYRPEMARKLIGMREQIKNYQGKD